MAVGVDPAAVVGAAMLFAVFYVQDLGLLVVDFSARGEADVEDVYFPFASASLPSPYKISRLSILRLSNL